MHESCFVEPEKQSIFGTLGGDNVQLSAFLESSSSAQGQDSSMRRQFLRTQVMSRHPNYVRKFPKKADRRLELLITSLAAPREAESTLGLAA